MLRNLKMDEETQYELAIGPILKKIRTEKDSGFLFCAILKFTFFQEKINFVTDCQSFPIMRNENTFFHDFTPYVIKIDNEFQIIFIG